jgi:hypothetical protein
MPSDKLYTPEQKARCVIWYIETGHSPKQVQINYRSDKIGWGRHVVAPSSGTIVKWYQRFETTASLTRKKKEGNKWVVTPEVRQSIVDLFKDPLTPPPSTRQAAAMEGMPSRASILRVLKEEKFHAYKLRTRQALSSEDKATRVRRCKDLLGHIERHITFLNSCMFSDEAHFHLSGYVNRQNYRYWSEGEPDDFVSETVLHPQRITVWAAIGKDGVIGPIFDPVGPKKTVTAESYLHMLKTEVVPAARRKGIHGTMVFMQDGAPPHFSKQVRRYLNQQFSGRWIGRDGSAEVPTPMVSPPYSPDLTPCDFFLWGYIKERVYKTGLPRNLAELKARIVHEFHNLPQEMIDRSVDATARRLRECIAKGGGSVE